MEVQEAIQQAQAHIQNAMELAKRPIGKEELLYMWDNQITALDNFLADTEVLDNPLLEKARGSMRTVKKQLTDAVIQFEAQAEGVELEEEPEPSEEEWAESYLDQGLELLDVVKEVLKEKVDDVKDLPVWEEPLSILNGYLADSEPFQEVNKDLRKVRSVVRAARRDLKNRVQDVFDEWRESDMKAS